MGVYNKDAVMPPSCVMCKVNRIDVNCKRYEAIIEDIAERRADDCPLVEVKEPHGRLKDADKLLRGLLDEWKLDINYDGIINEICTINAIQNAPTVIEAEGE